MDKGKEFADRVDAAQALCEALAEWRGRHAVVVAIPRGAVPMACLIADRLDADLDLVLVRKIGAPRWDEVAVGAVDESGRVHVAEHAARYGAVPPWIEQEARRQMALLHDRRMRYTPGREAVPLAGRPVIVVDDGLATGETMLAALQALRAQRPSELVCAVPVGSTDALARIADEADRVVCLRTPEDFGAVSQWYERFDEVTDEQVVELLRRHRDSRQAGTTASGDQRVRSASDRLASYP